MHSGGPIFPYPDLPPEEVLTTPLPRHFNISSPDGTSPSQSPCPCLASRCRHAWVAQDLWEKPHNLWESPGRPEIDQKSRPGGHGSSKRPSFEKTGSRVKPFLDVQGARGPIFEPRPAPKNDPKSRRAVKMGFPGSFFWRFLLLLAIFSIFRSNLYRFWTKNRRKNRCVFSVCLSFFATWRPSR